MRRRLRAAGDRPQGSVLRTRAGRGDTRTDKKSFVPQLVSVLTAITAVLAILISWLTFKMQQDGQYSARYTSAVEQFGNQSLRARTGAVYLLGRLAVESSDDREIIVKMLADYVKQQTGMGEEDPDVCDARPTPPLDVVAAMRMLFFRIERKPGDEQIDLRRVCLLGVEMPAASWMTPNSSGRNSTEPI